MSLISDGKELIKLAAQVGNGDLYQRLVELQSQIVEISGRVLELETENRSLKEALDLKAEVVFERPYYFAKGDAVPYCANCWESSRKAIHLTDSVTAGRRWCNTCRSSYRDEDAKKPLPGRGGTTWTA